MDDKIDRKIYVTAIQFLMVQNRQQTHDWTLIGSGANGLGIQEWLGMRHGGSLEITNSMFCCILHNPSSDAKSKNERCK